MPRTISATSAPDALGAARSAARTDYSTREAAELTGLNPRRIRHFVERGLLAPGRGAAGGFRFSFRDVVLLRTAKSLLDAKVSSRRMIAALTQAKETFSCGDSSLASMRIFAEGNVVLLRDEDNLWEVETRQGRFAFEIEPAAGAVHVLERPEPPPPPAVDEENLDTHDWYNIGLDYEETDPARAPAAYRRALALDAGNIDAHVNLGRLHQICGDLANAERHYRLALEAVPEHQLAIYNLGTIFDERDQLEAALDCYRRSPNIPDAHYNQARICELRGDELGRARHLKRYRALADAGE